MDANFINKFKSLLNKYKFSDACELFAKETKLKTEIVFLKHGKYFHDDKHSRDIYKIVLKKDGKQLTVRFGQSLANTGKYPTLYDVLACLTKYDPCYFEDFCDTWGYVIYNNKDLKIYTKLYHATVREWEGVNRLFSETEIEMLREII